jgi:hypothetical protein
MIVGYNEAKLLPACLESINFCDDIIYTDLGSNDDSIKIVKTYTDRIYLREKSETPFCEIVQAEIVHLTKHDWVIFIDPDEVVDNSLAEEIKNNFINYDSDFKLGSIVVPWQFYFKKHRLKGTVWGGVSKKTFLVNKHRFTFSPIAHYGRKTNEGFSIIEIKFDGEKKVLHHYWMNSLNVFLKKHFRYLKTEGISKYNLGDRSGYKIILTAPFKEFYYSFIVLKGYKDFFWGFILSIFWSYYKTYSK